MQEEKNTNYMSEAVKYSHYAIDDNSEGPFEYTIVEDNKIIAKGWNMVTTDNDPTSHAEVNCVRKAFKEVNDFKIEGGILYTLSYVSFSYLLGQNI